MDPTTSKINICQPSFDQSAFCDSFSTHLKKRPLVTLANSHTILENDIIYIQLGQLSEQELFSFFLVKKEI